MPTKNISFSSIHEAKKMFASLWEQSIQEHVIYQIIIDNKPIGKFIPHDIEESDEENFETLSEKSLDFWKGNQDDIFMKCHAIR